jgi:hypothetical protein
MMLSVILIFLTWAIMHGVLFAATFVFLFYLFSNKERKQ